MKAIRFHRVGAPDVLQLEDVPLPVAEAGSTLVRLRLAGVNYAELYQRSGISPVPLPFMPGTEGMGIVEQDSERFVKGERVVWVGHPGSHAEFAAVPDWRLIRVPGAVSDEQAAACLMQGMTAHYLSEDCFVGGPDHTALVHAGAGGTGRLLIQMLQQRGVRVIATVSDDAKAELAYSAGAIRVINYRDSDFVAEVRALAGSGGVDVVYDSVGKASFDGSLSLVRPHGSLILYGHSSGVVAPIDPMRLSAQGSIRFIRPTLAHFISDPASLSARASAVMDAVRNEKLKLHIGGIFPLADAAAAHAALESRTTVGKQLLRIA